MKALFLSTYPIDVPRHGGQIRSAAIVAALREQGWIVEYLSVYNPAGYHVPALSAWHVPLSQRQLITLSERGERTDVNASDPILNDDSLFTRVASLILVFQPDMFVLEQPWLWPIVRRIVLNGDWSAGIVYSSQNNETALLASSLSRGESGVTVENVRQAAALERDLIAHADAIVCVSEGDRRSLDIGGTPCIVAPNGVGYRAPPSGLDHWRSRYSHVDFALFVGSAHPPNAHGFSEMFSPLMSGFPPDKRIVVVGGVGDLLPKTPLLLNHGGLNAARIDMVGSQDEGALSTFIHLCRGFVLPIKTGGGTNLKTAEALYSRKPIVSTAMAFRGYEKFRSFPGVRICDEPESFQAAVLDMLCDPFVPQEFSKSQIKQLDGLTWTYRLEHLASFLETSVRNQHQKPTAPISFSGPSLSAMNVFGWHPYEVDGGHCWSSDRVAIIRLPSVGHEREELVCSLSFKLLNPDAEDIVLQIFAGERLASSSLIKNHHVHTQTISILASDLLEDGTCELLFLLPKLRCAADYGLVDSRYLGLHIVSLEVMVRSCIEGAEIGEPDNARSDSDRAFFID